MATFDLDRFRDIAFGRRALPDHPMRDVASAQRLLQLLPEDDPDKSIADLTQWAVGVNRAADFTPGRRARVFMLLDDAARPVWRALGQRYLAPEGRPLEKGDGDRRILRALHDSAFEFAAGFALCLEPEARRSRWITAQLPRLAIRRLRWLHRRLALAHMLHAPVEEALWEDVHRVYREAAEAGCLQAALPAFEGVAYRTSVRREYVRALLLDLAHPSGMRPRAVELSYRVAARVANAVQLSEARTPEAGFAVVPQGASRPTFLGALKPGTAPLLYIATALALPRLREFLERDRGRDAGEEDTLFGRGFTLRERRAVLERLIDFWGFDPPRRRTRRVRIAAAARLVTGFEHVVNVLPPAFKDQMAGDPRDRLRLKLNQTSKSLKRASLRAAQDWRGRVVDASTGGLGLAVNARTAPPLRQGMLMAVLMEQGKDWSLGVLRRIFASGDELRLGIQVIALRPCTLWLEADLLRQASVWEEAMRHEARFGEHFPRALFLEPPALPLAGGECLLAPGLASRGTRFGVPLSTGHQEIRIDRLLADTEDFQRAAFAAAPGQSGR